MKNISQVTQLQNTVPQSVTLNIEKRMELEIQIEKAELKLAIEKMFVEKLSGYGIKINVVPLPKKNNKKTQLVKDNSAIQIILSQSLISDHYLNKTSQFEAFYNELLNIFDYLSKLNDKIILCGHSFSILSAVYEFDGQFLHFPFNFLSTHYKNAFDQILKLVFQLNNNLLPILEKNLRATFEEVNGEKHFSFQDDRWNLIDPLILITKDLNAKFREKKDFRVKKPHIAVNENNIFKHFVFETNWVLEFDGLETLMAKPNDVSVYSNIAEQNLNNAENFYNQKISTRHDNYHGAFPNEKEQKEYFDYFTLIIQAVIFSYTTLEAFANICIPEGYEFIIDKNDIKTIYNKVSVERNFSLRDKFKMILPEILSISDVTKTKWWNDFISLENLRNEIVHSKPSKSEDRYSSLLEKKIFKIVRNHRNVIKFYGEFIYKNYKQLLEEYPYDMGYDEVYPGIMTEQNYNEMYKEIFNIKL